MVNMYHNAPINAIFKPSLTIETEGRSSIAINVNPDPIKKTLQHFYHYVIQNGANPNSSEINPIDEHSNTTIGEKIFDTYTTYRATRKKNYPYRLKI